MIEYIFQTFLLEIPKNAARFLLSNLSLNSKIYYLKIQSLYHPQFLLLRDSSYVADYGLIFEYHILLNETVLFLCLDPHYLDFLIFH